MAKSDGGDFFKRTSLFWIVSVTLGMGYFTVSAFNELQVKQKYGRVKKMHMFVFVSHDVSRSMSSGSFSILIKNTQHYCNELSGTFVSMSFLYFAV